MTVVVTALEDAECEFFMYCCLRYRYRYDNSTSSAAANNILASSWYRMAPWSLITKSPWRLTMAPWRLTMALWRLAMVPWRLTMAPWRLTKSSWRLTMAPRRLRFRYHKQLDRFKRCYHRFAPALEIDQMVSRNSYYVTLNGFMLFKTRGLRKKLNEDPPLLKEYLSIGTTFDPC
jgi:hypothetical protein